MLRLAAFALIAACSDGGVRASIDPEVTTPASPRADLANLASLERELRELDKQIATTTSSVAASPDPALRQSTKLQLVRLQQQKKAIEQRIAAAKQLEQTCKNEPDAEGCSR